MKSRYRIHKWSILILTMLSIAALAAPRIATIRLESGSATLGGQSISKVAMASEGQVLNLPAGSTVRVQLLGGNSELRLTGPYNKPLQKQDLLANAKPTKRGAVEVAKDIGSTTSSAAGRTRAFFDPPRVQLALNPVLPATLAGSNYVVELDNAHANFPPEDHYLEVSLLEAATGVEVAPPRLSPPNSSRIEFDNVELNPNVSYSFQLVAHYNEPTIGSKGEIYGKGETTSYSQNFRLLDQEERAYLENAKRELSERAEQEKSVLPLLQLAAIYQDFDQQRDSLAVLQQAQKNLGSAPKDKEIAEQIEEVIKYMEPNIEMKIWVTKP